MVKETINDKNNNSPEVKNPKEGVGTFELEEIINNLIKQSELALKTFVAESGLSIKNLKNSAAEKNFTINSVDLEKILALNKKAIQYQKELVDSLAAASMRMLTPPPLSRQSEIIEPPPIPSHKAMPFPPLTGFEDNQQIPETQKTNFPPSKISAMKERIFKKIDSSCSPEEIDSYKRSVEQVILRNQAFIIHKIINEEQKDLRHNDNSNVAAGTSYEDDIDILLSLEPSISCSSVTSGKKSELWSGSGGVIIGGGEVSEAGTDDIGSRSHGIKNRGGEKSSIAEIDLAVGRNDEYAKQIYEKHGELGMNEIVVNNAAIYGYFQHADIDKDGKMWTFDLDTKEQSLKAGEEQKRGEHKYPGSSYKILQKNISDYKKRFLIAAQRGMPLFVMTANREIYQCLNVNDDGSIDIGKKITPEDVAKGRAGLPDEERKIIGEQLMQKNIFRDTQSQKEAEKIIDGL